VISRVAGLNRLWIDLNSSISTTAQAERVNRPERARTHKPALLCFLKPPPAQLLAPPAT
jgi:hypothetical protein